MTRPGKPPRFDLDRTLDRLLTSRVWGFPLMLVLLAVVFWITIAGRERAVANAVASLLIDTIYPIAASSRAAPSACRGG